MQLQKNEEEHKLELKTLSAEYNNLKTKLASYENALVDAINEPL
jgi:chaperonin cofactor prefoldin